MVNLGGQPHECFVKKSSCSNVEGGNFFKFSMHSVYIYHVLRYIFLLKFKYEKFNHFSTIL
jgi:hypothetical protein